MKKIHYSFTAALLLTLTFACSAWAADTAELYGEGRAAYDAGDYEKAFAVWSQAAEAGHAQAQNELGAMYRNGRGVAQDDEKAVFWYRKAAEQGDAWGQRRLAWFFRNGVGVKKDEKQAVEWYRKSADQGNAEAQYSLGVIYANGWGVRKNPEEAVSWWRKAAEQGDKYGQYNLGRVLNLGEGVTKDSAQAAPWLFKAAQQGHTHALHILRAIVRQGIWKPSPEEREAYDNLYKRSFPAFSSATLDDKPVTDDIFAGKKLTLVNFWATWCPPCLKEMPDLAKLSKSMPEGTQVVGILVDAGDKGALSKAEGILKRSRADFLQIKTNSEIEDATLTPNVIPTTIFVDSEGRLVGDYVISGPHSEKEFRAELETRLKLMERQEERRRTLFQ